MKRLLFLVLVSVLFAAPVSAQYSNTNSFFSLRVDSQLLLGDGTAGAPSLSFADDPDTGFYKVGGTVGFSQNGNTFSVFGYTVNGMQISNTSAYAWSNSSTALATADVLLYRDAANTLALRNSTAAQIFNIYNTFTDASNYERGFMKWDANLFNIGTEADGTGNPRSFALRSASGVVYSVTLGPHLNDSYDIGNTGTFKWRSLYLSRSIQGSKTKALSEASATTFVTVAIPQTAGANFAGGEAIWSAYASDGTDTQHLTGRIEFAAVNKAGTETCTIDDNQIGAEAASAGTLTCTMTCVTGLTNLIGLAANCTSSLSQTSFNLSYRLDMPQANTVTPQ